MLTMLAKDPKKRLSVSEIKKHPWYEGKTSTFEEARSELKEVLDIHKASKGTDSAS